MNELKLDDVKNAVSEYYRNGGGKKVVIRTGPGGADLFGEVCDSMLGYKRVYMNGRVPRILSRLYKFSRSYSGRYYRLIRDISHGT